MGMVRKRSVYVPTDLKDEVENFIRNKLADKPGSTFILLKNADHEIHDLVEQIAQTMSES